MVFWLLVKHEEVYSKRWSLTNPAFCPIIQPFFEIWTFPTAGAIRFQGVALNRSPRTEKVRGEPSDWFRGCSIVERCLTTCSVPCRNADNFVKMSDMISANTLLSKLRTAVARAFATPSFVPAFA